MPARGVPDEAELGSIVVLQLATREEHDQGRLIPAPSLLVSFERTADKGVPRTSSLGTT